MYEMRQKQRNELRQKKWFNYALLLTAIFLFSQGSSAIKTNLGYSVATILLSFFLHTKSVGDLIEKHFKIKHSIIANIAMLISLSAITTICYFNKLHLSLIVILDLAAILIYVIAAVICSKFNIGEEK